MAGGIPRSPVLVFPKSRPLIPHTVWGEPHVASVNTDRLKSPIFRPVCISKKTQSYGWQETCYKRLYELQAAQGQGRHRPFPPHQLGTDINVKFASAMAKRPAPTAQISRPSVYTMPRRICESMSSPPVCRSSSFLAPDLILLMM